VDILVGWPGGDWQTTSKFIGGVVGVYLFLIWTASILWAYRDIRGRTRDPVSQLIGLSIVTLLPLIGAPIYLVVRPPHTLRDRYDRQLEQEAILSELHSVSTCPECRRPVDDAWMVCAFCSHGLKEPCSACEQLLMNAWRHCPHCGVTRVQVDASAEAESEQQNLLATTSRGVTTAQPSLLGSESRSNQHDDVGSAGSAESAQAALPVRPFVQQDE
jgi:hypothetical protein